MGRVTQYLKIEIATVTGSNPLPPPKKNNNTFSINHIIFSSPPPPPPNPFRGIKKKRVHKKCNQFAPNLSQLILL